jgi:Icc-related predicted phosphoesterase
MRVTLISDTHNRCAGSFVPDGDLLIHAGDLTMSGKLPEVIQALAWLESMPHPHKVVIAGNHDFCFQKDDRAAKWFKNAGIHYLQDSEVTVEGLRIWGSPWQPEFHDWAFNLPRGKEIKAKWDSIPAGIDVLVTHGPPAGFGDLVQGGEQVGCADLLEALDRVQPRLHVFGHIHEARGTYQRGKSLLVNASMIDRRYQPVHEGIVIDLYSL